MSRDSFPFDLPSLLRALDGDAEIDRVPVDEAEQLEPGVVRLRGRGRHFSAEARWSRREAPRSNDVQHDDVERNDVERWDVALSVTLAAEVASGIDAGGGRHGPA